MTTCNAQLTSFACLVVVCVVLFIPSYTTLLKKVAIKSESIKWEPSFAPVISSAPNRSVEHNHEAVDNRVSNILLMGQFNYDEPLENVIAWERLWKQYFRNVVVAGPWNVTKRIDLTTNGILNHAGASDRGFVSPYINLRNVLFEYQDDSEIEGVLYLHDDALLNLTQWSHLMAPNQPRSTSPVRGTGISTSSKTWSSNVIYKGRIYSPESLYSMSYRIKAQQTNESGTVTFRYEHQNRTFSSRKQLLKALKPWEHWNQCINGYEHLIMDSEFQRYFDHEIDGWFSFPGYVQADMLLIPTKLAQVFGHLSDLHAAHSVFLECTIATIASILERDTRVVSVPLCTDWNYRRRNTPSMIKTCWKESNNTGDWMYHPFKIGNHGIAQYRHWLKRVQAPL